MSIFRRPKPTILISLGAPTPAQLPRTDPRTPSQRLTDQAAFDAALGGRR